jgi:hypothetical protein
VIFSREEKSAFIRPTRVIRVPIFLLRIKINVRKKISRKGGKTQYKVPHFVRNDISI